MEHNNTCVDNKERVEKWLNSLDDTERKMLINNYSRQAKDTYYIFDIDDYVDVLNKLLYLKNSTGALINCYVNEDPVVDHPGYRLNEFLNKEMVKQTMQR